MEIQSIRYVHTLQTNIIDRESYHNFFKIKLKTEAKEMIQVKCQ